jgi:hypothetical protein
MAKNTLIKVQVVGSDAWINDKYYKEGAILEIAPLEYERRKKVLKIIDKENISEKIEEVVVDDSNSEDIQPKKTEGE